MQVFAFARVLFPSEAKLAMRIAHAGSTSEFPGVSTTSPASKLNEVNINETPSMQNQRLRDRLDALKKTVKLGRRYFPHCSQVLDKLLLEDDMSEVAFLETGTPDEQVNKRRRFVELGDDVHKAFSKDKAASIMMSPSSSSSSPKDDAHSRRGSKKQKL